MRDALLRLLVLAASLLAVASPASAAERTSWVGRDIDDKTVFWTCSKLSGDNWTLKKNGKSLGDYEGVTSTGEFVELKVKGKNTKDRVRIYKDKLSSGSGTEWTEMAKGKWAD